MAEVDNPFWLFSWDLYHRPGVADACLALQDVHGVDVNVVLFCCWAGRCGRVLTDDELAAVNTSSEAWQSDIVRPLRDVRRRLKTQDLAPAEEAAALRETIKARELEAERIEQAILHGCLPIEELAPSPPAAVENLAAYLAVRRVEAGVSDAAHLATLLTAAFATSLHPLDAVWLVESRLWR